MNKSIENLAEGDPILSDILLLAMSRGQGFYSTDLCRLLARGERWTRDFREYLLKFLHSDALLWAEREVLRAEAQNVRRIRLGSVDYPAKLAAIADPPLLLFTRGILRPQKRVAVVGARRASRYGLEVASAIGAKLCRGGVSLVSGLARGIDSAVHQGALQGQTSMAEMGQLVAVLGSGLESVYPRENQHLSEKIVEGGGVVLSEYGMSSRPAKHHFPRRNRIISGLAAATIVVEAKAKSGSLITAGLANEQGRDVFAVPGPIDSALSRGCNELIAQGASPFLGIESLGDIVATARPGVKRECTSPKYGELAEYILHLLSGGSVLSIDAIAAEIPYEYHRIQAELALLESKDEVERLEGYCYARKSEIDIV